MRQRAAVHQLQLAPQRHAMGDARSDQAFVAQQLGDVMRGSLVERLYRDNRILSIGGGTREVMNEIISKQMGL